MACDGKKKLLVSFSGGETSAFMAQWLWKHKQDEFEMLFVFANTGQENEETLQFINQCENEFGFKINWIESDVKEGKGNGTRFTLTDFENAKRNGEPFEQVIKKYGIPNTSFLHCTRELKMNPIKAYAKSIWGKEKYYLAIGIRIDEFDRMNANKDKLRIIYPLIAKEMQPMSKKMINFYWKQMPFRLKLKGYQGNCITCYKKSDKKLFQIAKENPKAFEFFDRMEKQYGNGQQIFRKNRTTEMILEESKNWNGSVKDDSENEPTLFDNESCEVFSSCGD
jgi:7-cyano-7-deazaguanine synthase in queuosine biosynthesis